MSISDKTAASIRHHAGKKVTECAQLPFAPALDDQFYAESYELRKAASTMTTATIEWFQQNLVNVLAPARPPFGTDRTLSVLSIGSGEGDIDLEIIKRLTPEPDVPWKRLRYVALEPNPIHRDRFLHNLSHTALADTTEVEVRGDYFDPNQPPPQEQYDLVLLTHVLYYFDDPTQAIRQALAHTKPYGQVVIIHQAAVGIPQIQREHMLDIKGDEDEMLTADDIQNLIKRQSWPYQLHHIDAQLDVTPCLQQLDTGIKIMSFCMECDLRLLQEAKFAKVLQAFWQLAKIDDTGKAFIQEPLGVLVVQSVPEIAATRKPDDFDPVVDYWQLARQFDWSGTFFKQYQQKLEQQTQSSSLRLLDVACGTGRWLQAFHHYIQLDEAIESIIYDALDPCESAIVQVQQKMHPPFQQGTQCVSTIQAAELECGVYDLLWSMHGFYMVPRQDLEAVLQKCASTLNDTGVGLIALASRKSFYVDFYEQFRHIFAEGRGDRFTSAEDIVATLLSCEIPHQVHRILYEESIKADDLVSLEHYIKHEATINSFNKDGKATELDASKNISLEMLLSHPRMEEYLKSLCQDSFYHFPQEIWLITFKSLPKSR
ncbi:MAG: methyltransferase domain-containing protein [Cyanothece sp. SIO2G6]|nr:methyltransferase domain-containing protein [Cyanothece sp. SIO2G6]